MADGCGQEELSLGAAARGAAWTLVLLCKGLQDGLGACSPGLVGGWGIGAGLSWQRAWGFHGGCWALSALHPHCACLGGCGCDKKQVGTSLLLAGLSELTAQWPEQNLASLAKLSSVLYLLTQLITVT